MSDTFLLENRVHAQEDETWQSSREGVPTCPLTGDQHIQVLEDIPTSLLVDCYQRDLGIDTAPEFPGVERLQLCRSLNSQVLFFHPTVTGSSDFYEQLQNCDWYYPTDKYEYQRAANWIKPGDRVLDIGCGAAHFATYIPDACYHGLEPHVPPGFHARHAGPHILSENMTRHAMTNSQTYDVVCAFQVLEHMGDPQSFLIAALACLKPDGLLIIAVPNAESYITRIPNFVLNAPPHHMTWWNPNALCHLADYFKLSILDLAYAPVEAWETRLYWMHRISSMFSLHANSYFTASPSRRLFNMAAYLVAGSIPNSCKPSIQAQGASVILIAKKTKDHTPSAIH